MSKSIPLVVRVRVKNNALDLIESSDIEVLTAMASRLGVMLSVEKAAILDKDKGE